MVKLLEQHGRVVDELIQSYYELPWYKRISLPSSMVKLFKDISNQTQFKDYQVDVVWFLYDYFLVTLNDIRLWSPAVTIFLDSPLIKSLKLYAEIQEINQDIFNLLATHPYPEKLDQLISQFIQSECSKSQEPSHLLQLALSYHRKFPDEAPDVWLPVLDKLHLNHFLQAPYLDILSQSHYSLAEIYPAFLLLSKYTLTIAQWHALLIDWGNVDKLTMVYQVQSFGLLDQEILNILCGINEPLMVSNYFDNLLAQEELSATSVKQFFHIIAKNTLDESFISQLCSVLKLFNGCPQLKHDANGTGLQKILSAKNPIDLMQSLLDKDKKHFLESQAFAPIFLDLAASSNCPQAFLRDMMYLHHLGVFVGDVGLKQIELLMQTKTDVSSMSEALCYVYQTKLFFQEDFWRQLAQLENPHIWSRFSNAILLNPRFEESEAVEYSVMLMKLIHLDLEVAFEILLDFKANETLFNHQLTPMVTLLGQCPDTFKDLYQSLKYLAKYHILPVDLLGFDVNPLASKGRMECCKALIGLKKMDLNHPSFKSIILHCYQFTKLNFGHLIYQDMFSCLLLFKNMGILHALENLSITSFLSYKLDFHSDAMQNLIKLTDTQQFIQRLIEVPEFSPGFLDCAITLLKPILEQKVSEYQLDSSVSNSN